MTTSLGGQKGNALTMAVYNASASTILRGHLCAHNSVASNNPAATFLDLTQNKDYGTGTMRQLEIPLVGVKSNTTAGSTTAGSNGGVLGVAMQDILPGKQGLVCVYGVVQAMVLGHANLISGYPLIQTTNAGVLSIAATTDRNVWGIALEDCTPVTTVLRWALINCLLFAGNGAAAYNGKAY